MGNLIVTNRDGGLLFADSGINLFSVFTEAEDLRLAGEELVVKSSNDVEVRIHLQGFENITIAKRLLNRFNSLYVMDTKAGVMLNQRF